MYCENEKKEVLGMEIYNLYPGSWASNCYVLLGDGQNGRRPAAVVDPSADAASIVQFLNKHNARLEYILLTHGHFDHVMALDDLRDLTGAPAYVHKEDNEMLSDGEKNAYSFFFGKQKRWREADKLLEDGEILTLGGETLKVLSTSGHSKGSVCFLTGDKLITGDTIFAHGYGRYDLHGGNASALRDSLLGLRKLDGDLTIYPGHGESARLADALDRLL